MRQRLRGPHKSQLFPQTRPGRRGDSSWCGYINHSSIHAETSHDVCGEHLPDSGPTDAAPEPGSVGLTPERFTRRPKQTFRMKANPPESQFQLAVRRPLLGAPSHPHGLLGAAPGSSAATFGFVLPYWLPNAPERNSGGIDPAWSRTSTQTAAFSHARGTFDLRGRSADG